MRQLADIRPDYHMVKNYKFMGRFDTLLLKDCSQPGHKTYPRGPGP
jgi:hypothetical protein